MPPLITLLVVLAMLALLFVIERSAPLRVPRASLVAGTFLNLTLSGLAFFTSAVLVRPVAERAIGWSADGVFGFLHLLPVPLQFVLAILLMDLTFYWWHLANHRVPFLWRFHNVHHVDPALDVTTGFRFHFGEVALSAIFRGAQVLFIGISLPAYAFYEMLFQVNTLFHHSNVRLPIRWERLLNQLLVTPRMHGVHHSQVQGEANSNYGVVFPWWDRIHRTLGLNVPQARITIGVPAYSSSNDNRFWGLLLMPFKNQRHYWCSEGGEAVTRDPADHVGSRTTMAE